MSEVSVKSEFVPYFDPLTKPKVSKRKRVLRDTSRKEDNKRAKSKAKRNSPSVTPPVIAPRTVVWIGATLMQEESLAAYSLYYGLNDKRNKSEKVTLTSDQNLDHVYIMGVNCALQQCEDESSLLSIYTGIENNQASIEVDTSYDDRCKEIRDIVAKRKGNILINFKDTATEEKSDEYNIAHNMAKEKLNEADVIVVDDDEVDIVESLSIAEYKEETVRTEETVNVKEEEIEDAHMSDIQDEAMKLDNDNQGAVKKTDKDESSVTATEDDVELSIAADKPTWADSFNIRNLLSVLTAPFRRNATN